MDISVFPTSMGFERIIRVGLPIVNIQIDHQRKRLSFVLSPASGGVTEHAPGCSVTEVVACLSLLFTIHPSPFTIYSSLLLYLALLPLFIIDIIFDRVYDKNNQKKEDNNVPTNAAITMMKMIESLPEPVQERALEHMQQYIADIRDELKWSDSFGNSQSKLIAAARQAREEILQGKATPMNVEDL